MIINYFQKNKDYFKIRKLLMNNNPETTDKKIKNKIKKLNEFEHFSLFCEVFIEKPLYLEKTVKLTTTFQSKLTIDFGAN